MSFKVRYHISYHFINGPRLFGTTLLYQIGRAYCDAGAVVKHHLQGDYYEWTVVTEGCGYVITNGTRVAVKGGDVYLSFPGDVHAIESDTKNPLSYDFLTINTTDSELLAAMKELCAAFSGAERRIVRSSLISTAISSAISEINNEVRTFSGRLLSTLFEQIIAYTVRKFNADENAVSRVATEEERLCIRITDYIDTHLFTIKRLPDVCEEIGYNYNYLSNLFKRVTGGSIMDYYTRRRLDTATGLIAEGGRRISDIAQLLGYSSLYSFSRAYKKYYGVSPSSMLKRNDSSETEGER